MAGDINEKGCNSSMVVAQKYLNMKVAYNNPPH